jgi:hypothetical protein
LTGRYEGTAKNAAGEVITLTLALTEKDGSVSGTIHSSHGDFQITGGSHQGKTVTLQFDAEGTSGTISLEASEDKLVGNWSAGDDGGPLDVKKVAAPAATLKRKPNPSLSASASKLSSGARLCFSLKFTDKAVRAIRGHRT